MPRQIFHVDRAPEAKPITAREIASLLYKNRHDTEWSVVEISEATQSSVQAGARCQCGGEWRTDGIHQNEFCSKCLKSRIDENYIKVRKGDEICITYF